jgi:hypothetical protein
MMSKTGHLGAGNAAEKLRLTRAMPNLSLAAPLPVEGAPAVAVSRTTPTSASGWAKPDTDDPWAYAFRVRQIFRETRRTAAPRLTLSAKWLRMLGYTSTLIFTGPRDSGQPAAAT